ncbi:hypothetical protein EDD29_3066 [Actinocorallia herbida]|uniref:Cobalamin biosynthesis protein CbiX n=1 Tax=Actinocorallia herbida TaxID=58109 RepID=A0A3N1CW65_9ACTN|nr:cobalamin biosynthesis protein CbiX [Actinocorallia herbida]ROO85521.1 hypothetical protein EDD29_3066 [Actinocorallia herbida]
MSPGGRAILLAAGPESADGRCLPPPPGRDGPEVRVAGRDLAAGVRGHSRTVVVPMTLGRDPDLPVAAAQTLRWAARDRAPGDLLLAPPLGTTGHLVGWLRSAVVRALRGAPPRRAVLLVAPAGGPEQDAELFRVARLVRQYTSAPWVEVALTGGDPDVSEAIDRCTRLGAADVVLVPASFVPAPVRPDALTADPLLGAAALAALVRARAAEAEHRWTRHGDDGLAAAARHSHTHDHDHDHDHHHDDRRRDLTVPAAACPKEAQAHVG